MKRIISLALTLVLLLGLCACGGNDEPVSSTPQPAKDIYTENGVEVDKTAFPENTVLKVSAVKDEANTKIAAVKAAVPAAEEVVAYEITATSNNVAVQPNGNVEVFFPIPTTYDSEKHDVVIYYVADDGTTERIPSTLDGEAVVGTLSHFSMYVVMLIPKAAATTTAATTATTTATATAATTTTTKATTTTKKVTTTTTKKVTPTLAPFTAAEVKDIFTKMNNSSKWAFYMQTPDIFRADLSTITPEQAYRFIMYYQDLRNHKQYAVTTDAGVTVTVPLAAMTQLGKDVLNTTYDFTKLNAKEEDGQGVWYDKAKDAVIYVELGGGFGGPSDSWQYKSHAAAGSNAVAVTLEFYRCEETADDINMVPTGKLATLTLTRLSNGIVQLTSFKEN